MGRGGGGGRGGGNEDVDDDLLLSLVLIAGPVLVSRCRFVGFMVGCAFATGDWAW